jgi:hypothetical protein
VFRLSDVGQRGSWFGQRRSRAIALPENRQLNPLLGSRDILTNRPQNEQHVFTFTAVLRFSEENCKLKVENIVY